MPDDIDDIEVQHLIAHNVDHHELSAPRLSEREPPPDPEVAAFFARHVRQALHHQRAQESAFSGSDPEVADLCRKILSDPKRHLVAASQQVARRLFAAMLRTAPVGKTDEGAETRPKPDMRISPGELVVCTFRESGADPWLAILKMDPAEGFASEPQTIDGQFVIVFREVGDVMPTGELQKCAFVLPERLAKRRRHDLLVLDQQVTAYGGYRLASSFFTERFLRCEPVLDVAERNRLFILASQKFAEQQEWPEERRNEFHHGLGLTVQQARINVSQFAETHVPEEQQDDFLHHLRDQGLSQFVFRRDPEVAESLTRYEQFIGDAGLRLTIEKGRVGSGRMVSPVRDPATGEWIVTIRTTQWKPRYTSQRR